MNGVHIDLTGKVALITGASRGIGSATARLLANAGARVGLNYHRSETAAKELLLEIGADRGVLLQGDVADPLDAKRIVEEIVQRFGTIDIVVNNAATFAMNPFDNASYENWIEGWRTTFDLNVFGAANVSFIAMQEMRKAGGGKIINVASRAAFRGETEFADYGASKAALVNLTRSMARACSKDNIIATCVAPGFVLTEMAREEIEKNGADIVAQIPVGRVATPEEVANAILFLASPLADYLAGATIDVNGGSYFH